VTSFQLATKDKKPIGLRIWTDLDPDRLWRGGARQTENEKSLRVVHADTVLDAIERSGILRNVATRLVSYEVPDGLRIIDELSRNSAEQERWQYVANRGVQG
jgi:hypothetical protein